MTDPPSTSTTIDGDAWLAEWIAHCRECWQRMLMLRDKPAAAVEKSAS